MKTKTKILILLIFFVSVYKEGLAASGDFFMDLEKSDDNRIKVTGVLEKISEGNFSGIYQEDIGEYIIKTDINIDLEKKDYEQCDIYSWELHNCGSCVNGKQECEVIKRPGVNCVGEEGKPTNLITCLSLESNNTCDTNSWELYNCSPCDNGYKSCSIRKKWGIVCEGNTGKPNEIQLCDEDDITYCDENSWEIINCDYCTDGIKQCEVKKRWGIDCIGNTGKPNEYQKCSNNDISYCNENSFEYYDCTKCDDNIRTCKVRKKEGEICIGTKGKPSETHACNTPCNENSWQRVNCTECKEGKKICEITKKPEYESCFGDYGKPDEAKSCTTFCDEDSWKIENCGECNNGKMECEILKEDQYCIGEEGRPSKYQKCSNIESLLCNLNLPIAEPFKDIFGHWGEPYINQLRLWGVVHGKKSTVFAPNDTLSRAEFTKIALNAMCISTEGIEDKYSFPDIEKDKWYTRYILKAKQEGIIEGYQDGLFRPNQPINRSEAIKIILETANLDIPEKEGQWYDKYITYAKNKKIIDNYDETNKPANGTITRAEISKITVNTKNLKTNIALSD